MSAPRTRSRRRAPLELPPDELRAAERLYRGFHEREPKSVAVWSVKPRGVFAQVGKLVALAYHSDHGVRYVHKFRKSARPYLVASHDGRVLAIVGGRFRMTARGIVDQ